MNAIQVVLVIAAVVWLASFLVRFGGTAATRLAAIGAILTGVVLVIFPDLSVRLASFFGVTRGVDLVIYLSLVAFGFLWLHNAARLRELDQRLTDLIRARALERTRPAEDSEAPVPTPAGGNPRVDQR